jgi:phenylpropionate dioxygenase-like ring-hydroxylating dioxygenase large terminal subunit
MGYLRNVWYATAWADELGLATPLLARTVADQPLVIFRTNDGSVSALQDRCPHRFAPLSRGQRTEQGIRCGYHGLEFGSSGACIANPHGAVVQSLRVHAYPATERYGMIWVWLGELELSDPSAIPDMSFVSSVPPTAFSKGYLPTSASHLLLTDNILDLSHADYLHPETLGGGAMTRARARVEERKGSVHVTWDSFDETPIPIFKSLLPTPDTRVDMWTEVEWFPNGVMILHTGATPTGKPREEGIDTWNAHIMTPEGDASTHYFYCNSRNYMMDDAEFNKLFATGLRAAFEHEDKPMIEAQQQRVGNVDLLEQHPALLAIDSASVKVRRILSQMIKAESTATSSQQLSQ